jgi:hypothetical protein
MRRAPGAFACYLLALELRLVEPGKYPTPGDQLGKRPLLGNLTVLQD